MIYKELLDLDRTISKSLFIKYDNEFECLKRLKEDIIILAKNNNLKEIENEKDNTYNNGIDVSCVYSMQENTCRRWQ